MLTTNHKNRKFSRNLKFIFYCTKGRDKVQKIFLAIFNYVFTIYFMTKVIISRYFEINLYKLDFFSINGRKNIITYLQIGEKFAQEQFF